MVKKKLKIASMMSGGVDSSLATALLVEQGHDVTGFYIKCWSDETTCPWQEDQEDARRVAARLEIPFYSLNLEDEYKKSVVDYMIKEYREGRTPNPDILCNSTIKFGVFLSYAKRLGFEKIATGHYAQTKVDPKGRTHLISGKDPKKDQSYFLWQLTQKQLSYAAFPIGDIATKQKVRNEAKKRGLLTADKKDSQGICFLGEVELREFLREYIDASPGPIMTIEGRVIGEHIGLPFYTIGQRKGIGIGGGVPFYVAKKDESTNTLVVAPSGQEEQLYGDKLIASSLNWIAGEPSSFPYSCTARIRYQQPLQECTISKHSDKSIIVTFKNSQRAITEGQSIVFYNKSELLGGGVIN